MVLIGHPRNAGTYAHVLARYVREARAAYPNGRHSQDGLMPAMRRRRPALPLDARDASKREPTPGRCRIRSCVPLSTAPHTNYLWSPVSDGFVVVNGPLLIDQGKLRTLHLPWKDILILLETLNRTHRQLPTTPTTSASPADTTAAANPSYQILWPNNEGLPSAKRPGASNSSEETHRDACGMGASRQPTALAFLGATAWSMELRRYRSSVEAACATHSPATAAVAGNPVGRIVIFELYERCIQH